MNSREKRDRRSALMIMLSETEKAMIKEKSEEHGMTMSGYARWVLLANAKKEAEQNGEL